MCIGRIQTVAHLHGAEHFASGVLERPWYKRGQTDSSDNDLPGPPTGQPACRVATGGGRFFLGETLLVQRAVRWSLSAIWQVLAEYAAQDSNL